MAAVRGTKCGRRRRSKNAIITGRFLFVFPIRKKKNNPWSKGQRDAHPRAHRTDWDRWNAVANPGVGCVHQPPAPRNQWEWDPTQPRWRMDRSPASSARASPVGEGTSSDKVQTTRFPMNPLKGKTGDWLRTGAASGARLYAGPIGCHEASPHAYISQKTRQY